jgi:hypothetical protein
MLRVNRAHRWLAVAAVLLGGSYGIQASAAISPPKLGTCKPAPDAPEDGKEKATNPGGGKGTQPAAGEKGPKGKTI